MDEQQHIVFQHSQRVEQHVGGVRSQSLRVVLLQLERSGSTGHTEWCDGRVHHEGFTTLFRPDTVVNYLHTDGRTYDVNYHSRQEGPSATARTYAAITSRSYHSGTVNALMMDGSSRFISQSIDLGVWRALGTRTRTAGESLIGEF